MSAEAAKVLRDAAQVLRECGWTQGAFRKSNGRCCAVGAIRVAAEGNAKQAVERNPYVAEASVAVQRALQPELGWMNIADWNDAPERTADDVIGLLERVADEQAVQS